MERAGSSRKETFSDPLAQNVPALSDWAKSGRLLTIRRLSCATKCPRGLRGGIKFRVVKLPLKDPASCGIFTFDCNFSRIQISFNEMISIDIYITSFCQNSIISVSILRLFIPCFRVKKRTGLCSLKKAIFGVKITLELGSINRSSRCICAG